MLIVMSLLQVIHNNILAPFWLLKPLQTLLSHIFYHVDYYVRVATYSRWLFGAILIIKAITNFI